MILHCLKEGVTRLGYMGLFALILCIMIPISTKRTTSLPSSTVWNFGYGSTDPVAPSLSMKLWIGRKKGLWATVRPSMCCISGGWPGLLLTLKGSWTATSACKKSFQGYTQRQKFGFTKRLIQGPMHGTGIWIQHGSWTVKIGRLIC